MLREHVIDVKMSSVELDEAFGAIVILGMMSRHVQDSLGKEEELAGAELTFQRLVNCVIAVRVKHFVLRRECLEACSAFRLPFTFARGVIFEERFVELLASV